MIIKIITLGIVGLIKWFQTCHFIVKNFNIMERSMIALASLLRFFTIKDCMSFNSVFRESAMKCVPYHFPWAKRYQRSNVQHGNISASYLFELNEE